MFGKNPKRKAKTGDGSELDVQEIFATIQGEGAFVGRPAIFIRLGGCNLACEFCDTEFESFTRQSLSDILSEIKALANDSYKLVVITGGEPFRQPIEKLCDELLENGFEVQIETNGTLWRDIDKRVSIICSPKNISGKYHPIREDLLKHIDAFKFLISADDEKYTQVPEVGQSEHDIPVYVQPIDEYDEGKNLANQKLAVKIAQENNYILSLQIHKVLGLR